MTHWPDIPYERWKTTGQGLHMWLQIVGKARLAQTPWVNHSWHATFYTTAKGLSTSLIPDKTCSYEVTFDFVQHQLSIVTTAGKEAHFPLESMSVADFHGRFLAALKRLDLMSTLHQSPNEVPDPVPFHQQTETVSYDPEAAQNFWKALISIERVFKHFRTGFVGKVSPVHLFWGSLDLAVTRFSGRKAPLHPGGVPALPDSITREAYSHEVSSAGFWAGGGGVDYPAFYAYAYPAPEGFAAAPVEPEAAFFDQNLGEFILPYEAVRTAADPEQTLLRFLQSTYEAAARLGAWDRDSLERDLSQPREVPEP
jgi:hypothetical protein